MFLTINDCRITYAQRVRAAARQQQQKNEGRTLFWDGKNKKLPSGMNLQADLCVSWLDSHFQVHIVPQGRSENGPLLAGND
jgi:hypothetical protein